MQEDALGSKSRKKKPHPHAVSVPNEREDETPADGEISSVAAAPGEHGEGPAREIDKVEESTQEPASAQISPEESDEEISVADFAVDVEALVAELEDLKDRHLRLAAEFDNYRRRTRREHAELSSSAQAGLARRLLPTLDDLARVAATPTENTTVEALEKGIELVLRNLGKELGEAGLAKIEALDQAFDPELHQALMLVDCDDPDLDGTVSRVFVDGYRFGDRLIRPAQVEVRQSTPSTPNGSEEGERTGGE